MQSSLSTPITWISCGFEHCLLSTVYGTVASWGCGASGSLGHGNYMSYTEPKIIETGGIASKYITFIECGGYHNAAIDNQGQLYMWGRSDVGQLGISKEYLIQDELGFAATTPQVVGYFKD